MAVADILVTVCNMPGRLIRQITGQYYRFDGIPGTVLCKFASFISENSGFVPVLLSLPPNWNPVPAIFIHTPYKARYSKVIGKA